VDADGATIDSPSSDASVSSPLTVRYTLDGGAEDDVTVSVYDGWTRIGTRTDSAGSGQHTATLDYNGATSSVGYVVVADAQSASGTAKLQRLLVMPVRFSSSSTATGTPTQQYPAYFVAVKSGRLAVFYAKGGGFARWLTPAGQSPVSSPQLTSDHKWVYYLRDAAVWRVPINGGAAEHVSADGTVIAYSIGGAQNQLVAWATQDRGVQSVTWADRSTGSSGHFTTGTLPPLVEQLAWSPDGTHLAATVRSGNQWNVDIFDTKTAKSVNDGVPIECPAGQACSAPSYDSAGKLYFVTGTGATTWSVLQWTGKKVMHVSTWDLATPISPEQATNDFTPDAEAAIVGTPAGHISRIEHGIATLLPTRASQPTW
jgi:hypothetical protein